MPKTNDHNTKINSRGESRPLKFLGFMDYFDIFSLKRLVINQEFLELLAKQMIKWAQRKTSLKFNQFLHLKGISSSSYYGWYKNNPALWEAHKYTLEAIGTRRELGGLNKELEPNLVRLSMPNYDKEWERREEWRASLKQSGDNSTLPKIVVIEKFIDPEKVNISFDKECGCRKIQFSDDKPPISPPVFDNKIPCTPEEVALKYSLKDIGVLKQEKKNEQQLAEQTLTK